MREGLLSCSRRYFFTENSATKQLLLAPSILLGRETFENDGLESGGLGFKAHRLVYYSTLGWIVITKKKKLTWCTGRLVSSSLLLSSLELSDASMGLECGPASEPLHIFEKILFLK